MLGICRPSLFFCQHTPHTTRSTLPHHNKLFTTIYTIALPSLPSPTMSSSAASTTPTVAAAKVSTAKKNKSTSPIYGFDQQVADRLLESFHSATQKSSIQSVRGATSLAFKSLKSSFTAGKGRKRNNDASTPLPAKQPAVSPSTKKLRRSSSQRRPLSAPSPIKFPNYDDDSDSDSSIQPYDDIFNITRHDELFNQITSASKGVRRLPMKDIYRLNTGDEFV